MQDENNRLCPPKQSEGGLYPPRQSESRLYPPKQSEERLCPPKQSEGRLCPPKQSEGRAKLEKLRDYAKLLYIRDRLSQEEISFKTGLHRNTVNRWAAAGGWKKLQRNFLLTRDEQVGRLLDELAELNASILEKPQGKRFADFRECGIRRKLVRDIKELETTASVVEAINNCKALMTFIVTLNPPKARELAGWVDQYVQSLVKHRI